MQMSYAFEFLSGSDLTAARVAEVFAHLQAVAGDGWACWAYSNHDVVRHISRWKLSDESARAYTTLLMCLRGSACIYQGEELGLPEADIAYEDLQDPYGIEFWPEFKGRDGCRTPMVWNSDNQNGGFSTHEPWLPVPSAHLGLAVDAQQHDPDALLHHYRRAIAFRHAHIALQKGAMTDISVDGDMLSFRRTLDAETILCVFNLSDQPAEFALPKGDWVAIGAELGAAQSNAGQMLQLAPWQCSIQILEQA
jgi:alpha-glucosidase